MDLLEKLGGAVHCHSQSGVGLSRWRASERTAIGSAKRPDHAGRILCRANSGLKAEDFDTLSGAQGDYTATARFADHVDALNADALTGNGEYINSRASNPVFKGTTWMMMLGPNHIEDRSAHRLGGKTPPRNLKRNRRIHRRTR
jgi:hypothetical protein